MWVHTPVHAETRVRGRVGALVRAWVGSGFSASAAAFSGANRRTEMVSFPPRTARHWGLCEGERVPHLPNTTPTPQPPGENSGLRRVPDPRLFPHAERGYAPEK